IEIPERDLDRETKLKYEKELMGLYITDHPLMGHEGTLSRRATHTTLDAKELSSGSIVTLGGVVSKLEKKTTRRGDQMLVLNVEDFHGTIEATMFSKIAAAQGHLVREDGVVLVKGRINNDGDRLSFSVMDVESLRLVDGVPELRLNLPLDTIARNRIDELRDILRRHPGDSPVYLHVGPNKVLELGREFSVQIERVVPDLRVAFGIDVVRPSG
ncbi:MAG: OB-fold nucleic acid binding domain-containing protein, partial [Ilumatobacteraceae bacterium]